MSARWKLLLPVALAGVFVGAAPASGVTASAAPAPPAPHTQPTAPTADGQSSDAPHYGAIAYSTTTSHWGRGAGVASQAVANARAMHYCQATGATDCVVRVEAHNTWGALSVSWANGPWGAATGLTEKQATDSATSWCRKSGGGDSCDITTTVNAT
jgi:hypothetical protein